MKRGRIKIRAHTKIAECFKLRVALSNQKKMTNLKYIFIVARSGQQIPNGISSKHVIIFEWFWARLVFSIFFSFNFRATLSAFYSCLIYDILEQRTSNRLCPKMNRITTEVTVMPLLIIAVYKIDSKSV